MFINETFKAIELPVEPSLNVKNLKVGQLKLPLIESQAQDLIQVCNQASYGMNKTRIIDKHVRDSFELEPAQFEIKHPDWQPKINMLAQNAVNQMLETDEIEITAKLHKLLLYKKNGHFKRHQDNTSKDEHMFGTLIVQLPSEYTGGEFVTYYEKAKKIHDFGQSTGNLIFLAIYI